MKSIRLAIVGDIHGYWNKYDVNILQEMIQPNHTIFVGDFQNEDTNFISNLQNTMNEHNLPFTCILGNHDAWATTIDSVKHITTRIPPYDVNKVNNIQKSLEILSTNHVGFSHKNISTLNLSIIGGRPCSWGGPEWSNNFFGAPSMFYKNIFDINSFQESANIITNEINTSKYKNKIVIGHNGPTGLGTERNAIVGQDFSETGGDFGDPDFEIAIVNAAKHSNHHIPLCLFGHMHHLIKPLKHKDEIWHGDQGDGNRIMCMKKDNIVYVVSIIYIIYRSIDRL